MKEKISTNKAPAAIGPYSQAIKIGKTLYTSGQIALDPKSGAVVGNTAEAQTERVMQNLEAVLEAAGMGFCDVIKTTCFLTSMADFAAFNEVYAKYMSSLPARSCVEVCALPKGALVEVELVAYKE